MSNKTKDQTLALASMMQCAQLIHQLATTGAINQPAFEASMDTLFQFDNATTLEVFGDLSALITGFKTILSFDKHLDTSPEQVVLYYVLSMMKLASKINKNTSLINKIQKGLENIQLQSQQFDLSINASSHKVDLLYQECISTLKPRIMVQGDQRYLSPSDNTSKVRTLLFSGIRAAFLWQQLGGSKWKLLFSKKQYLHQAEDYLKNIQIV